VVNFNILGGAGTTSVLGDLKIGAGQTAFFNKNDNALRSVVFPTVTLTGGNATFSVGTPRSVAQEQIRLDPACNLA
jgi:hypothetical protein